MLQNGWLNTGGFVRMNEDGYAYFIGRGKDIIRRGGENFAPIEVEEALDSHPGVRASAVVAVLAKLAGLYRIHRRTADDTESADREGPAIPCP